MEQDDMNAVTVNRELRRERRRWMDLRRRANKAVAVHGTGDLSALALLNQAQGAIMAIDAIVKRIGKL